MTELIWTKFNQEKRVSLSVNKNDPAKFYVKYPCHQTVWYKLFLKTKSGALLGHVELYRKKSSTSDLTGNFYCKGAGSKSWWGGQKTDFNLKCDALKCRDEMKVLKVEKTSEYVKLVDANTNEVLWSKVFSSSDGDCRLTTSSV